MSNILQLLESIEERVRETRNDLFGFMLEGEEPLSDIEAPVLDALLEDIRDMIDDRRRRSTREEWKVISHEGFHGDSGERPHDGSHRGSCSRHVVGSRAAHKLAHHVVLRT